MKPALFDQPEIAELADDAVQWFKTLRDSICQELEAIEAEATSELYQGEAATFTITPWDKAELDATRQKQKNFKQGANGGGEMGMMRGRAIEKAGVHFSCVYGEFSENFRAQIPGANEDPRFFASGISVIVHPRNPHMPAAHMNTRLLITKDLWFGGGGDLNPMLPQYRDRDHEDSQSFHAAFQQCCNQHAMGDYDKMAATCNDYFYLPHRDEHRGVGGIFYDRLNSGDSKADFAFTQDVGKTFRDAYMAILRQRLNTPWDAADRTAQAMQRGRYAEFNLLYDRGTQFGLKTGGNVESILSSLPPIAEWK